jgi:DNA-binding IclR family transcriptional regulator
MESTMSLDESRTLDRTSTPTGKKGPEGGRAIERAALVLMELAKHSAGISLSDFSRRTGIAVGTLHRTISILKRFDLVRERPDGLLAVGVGAAVLAGAFLEGLDLRDEARPFLTDISLATGETVHLGILSSPHIVYIEKIDSPNAVRMVSRVGGTNPVLTTAIGKSVLAFSDEDYVSRVIAESSMLLGDLVEEKALRSELELTRSRGYSTDAEGNEPGIRCVAAPVFDSTGLPVAAISVSSPAHRFDVANEAALGELIANACAELSRRLGYLPRSAEGMR